MYFWKTLACEQQTYFRSSLLSLLVMVVKFTFQSVYLVTLAKIQDGWVRSLAVTRAVFYPLSWLANIKTKGFTSRKSFCRSGSQTLSFGEREATTGNTSAVRRLGKGLLGCQYRTYLTWPLSFPVLKHFWYYFGIFHVFFLFLAHRLCSHTSNGPGLSRFKMINEIKRDHREWFKK